MVRSLAATITVGCFSTRPSAVLVFDSQADPAKGLSALGTLDMFTPIDVFNNRKAAGTGPGLRRGIVLLSLISLIGKLE